MQERALLARYIDRFNARDFDALRAMLADEVRLDLVNRTTRQGRADVGEYFHRYAELESNWQLALGAIENRPAVLFYDSREPSSQPAYFILLTWEAERIALIRDFRYAPYVLRDAELEEGDRSCNE